MLGCSTHPDIDAPNVEMFKWLKVAFEVALIPSPGEAENFNGKKGFATK